VDVKILFWGFGSVPKLKRSGFIDNHLVAVGWDLIAYTWEFFA
jgi:hypothetical protein